MIDLFAALVYEHRVAILLTLFAGVCYWAFKPALRRRRAGRRDGRGS